MAKLKSLIPLLAAASGILGAQSHTATTHVWKAQWIDVPGSAPQEYGVYHFRRAFDLPSKPEHFVIYVSGDNRYELFVNGVRVSWGPARGDLTHWRYESVDIGSQLRDGKNVLAAVVWNEGENRAIAQISNRTGFVLEAARAEDVAVNTGRAWKCVEDKAYAPQPIPRDQVTGYYALGPNEKVDAKLYPWGWEQSGYDDSTWVAARELSHAAARDARDAPNRWMLVAREIPLEEQTPETDLKIRKTEGLSNVSGFPLRVAAHTKVSVLLDQDHLTTAFPELSVSGGAGASVSLHYAEALYVTKNPIVKGNRNDIEGKQFYGPFDTYILDGGRRSFRPLFWRTYRYIRLDVTAGEEPVTVESLRGVFTAYPFERKAQFMAAQSSSNEEIQKILTTGWHTARLCAHETYMDCPFYEELQYAGDARIQMLISLYMTGDSRLMKNGIGLLNSSRTAEGATLSRAPSHLQQYIPPFSLWWIGMVRDYWWYVDDPDFAREMLPGVRAVLTFYAGYQKANGSLSRMPWWNFVDWVKAWPNGEPPADPDGSSAAALDLQLLMAYRWAGDLESALGDKALAAEDREKAAQLKATVLAADWDAARGLFADQPTHRTYSQQVNTLAVLAHVVEGEQARAVVTKTIADASLAKSSIYFRAYMNATLREVGLGERYLEMLGPWREMLGEGLSTWAEWNGPDTRSDCHAWGASPNFELLRTIAGIDSEAAGFKRVRIAPNLGSLKHVTAEMPHPHGMIRIDLKQDGGKLSGEVELPGDVDGEFDWNGQQRVLRAGKNSVAF
ncbi:MAG: glycoside hydrolase family 78 protein [Acidobacteriota bacterium]|nr:glycoside hydrolase family 78 protein [Acidobacteriota bacterium]